MGKKGKKEKKPKEPKVDLPMLYYGTGTFKMENGDVYEGEYCAHRGGLVWREGKGVYTTHDGHIYTGMWKDDKLLENEEVIIQYANGHVFLGRLTKGKYNGPGTYCTRPDIAITAEFKNNKPVGSLIMIDREEDLWYAIAEESDNKCIFQLQNYFYADITEDRGQGIPKIIKYPKEAKKKAEEKTDIKSIKTDSDKKKSISTRTSLSKPGKKGKQKPTHVEIVEEEEHKETEEEKRIRLRKEKVAKLFDREKEKKIFAQTEKTVNDIDFTECSWYQDFLKFHAVKKCMIKRIQQDGKKGLNMAEKVWCRNYKVFKEINELRKVIKELLMDPKTDRKYFESLLSDFRKYKSQAVNVNYPRKDWDIFFDPTGETWDPSAIPKTQNQNVFDDVPCGPNHVTEIIEHSNVKDESLQTNPKIEFINKVNLFKMVGMENRVKEKREKREKLNFY